MHTYWKSASSVQCRYSSGLVRCKRCGNGDDHEDGIRNLEGIGHCSKMSPFFLSCRLLNLEGNRIAEVFEFSHVVAFGLFGSGTLEVVRAKVLVGLAICEHMPGNDQDRVRDRNESSLLAAVDHNTSEHRCEIGTFGTRGDPGETSQPWLPCLVLPDRRLPALTRLPGHSPAQLARCRAEGNCPMLVPISAITAVLQLLYTETATAAWLSPQEKKAILHLAGKGISIGEPLMHMPQSGRCQEWCRARLPARQIALRAA